MSQKKVGEPGWEEERTRADLVEMVEYLHQRCLAFLNETACLRAELAQTPLERDLTHTDLWQQRDTARNVARSLWLMWTYAEKEERDPTLTDWIKNNYPWLTEDT